MSSLEHIAASLRQAEQDHQAMAAPTESHPGFSIANAYEVQMCNVRRRVAEGGIIIGKKVGLTSRPMQEFLGVNEPDFGHLFADMLYDEERPISAATLLQPKIEAEIAFILAEDISGPGVTFIDVLRATRAVAASFEIIASRVKDWKIKIQDTIADNGSSAGLIIGGALHSPDAVDLKTVGLVLEKNGLIIDTAAGAAVMGHPAQAVAWLANALGAMGEGLRKGEIILSGSLTKAYEIAPGDVFTARFGQIGTVKAVFGA